jgi:hypothetical protein
MRIDREIPGQYTANRITVDENYVLIAENPDFEIINVSIRLSGRPSISADCIFTHKVGDAEKRDFINFDIDPNALAASPIRISDLIAYLGDTTTLDVLIATVIAGAAPGVVNLLTDNVTAEPA